MTQHRRSKVWTALLVLVGLAVLVGLLAWWHLFRQVPQELADDSFEERYKYGSIGTEDAGGVPYWIWLVLPKMFPEYLPNPGGYAGLGFPWEQGRELPVGFSKRTIGFERVGINCALCHAGTVRKEGDVTARLYVGAPGTTQDILAYQRFLFACAADPRFTAGNIMNAIGQVTTLSPRERLLYRFVLIPQTRKELLNLKAEFEWTNSRPDWGRGRIDPFNPVKVAILDVDPGDTIGNSDMQPIWNLADESGKGRAYHWDGLNTSVHEVVVSSALGDGATEESLPMDWLQEVENHFLNLPAPPFDELFPDQIDPDLARAGKAVFARACDDCHGPRGETTGKALPLSDDTWRDELGDHRTDPHRAQMWTQEAADAYNRQQAGPEGKFQHFRSTGGYVSVPLDGLWLRAPYLHNGSVPYLDELFLPPAERTERFVRGYDVYDPERMGFVAEGEDAARLGTIYDTSETGNSNQGHLWGTDLPGEDKRALLEYLKTL
ncbi:MAG: cytochrome c [Acidobacteriota bacterium]|nr:cytochrome c [Acidobacteriota bacterium]